VRVASAAAQAKAQTFLFASSGGAIYGEQSQLPAPEDHPLRGESPYGLSKQCGEIYLDYFARQSGMRGSCSASPTSMAPARTRTARPGWSPSSPRRCCAGDAHHLRRRWTDPGLRPRGRRGARSPLALRHPKPAALTTSAPASRPTSTPWPASSPRPPFHGGDPARPPNPVSSAAACWTSPVRARAPLAAADDARRRDRRDRRVVRARL